MSLIRMASNAAMVTVKSSQVYRVPPVSQGNQGERSQQEKKGQEELRSGDRHSPWQWYPWICCSIPHHFRLYLEPKLHCRKLRPSHEENDMEGADGTWIPVEPHQVLATGNSVTIIAMAADISKLYIENWNRWKTYQSPGISIGVVLQCLFFRSPSPPLRSQMNCWHTKKNNEPGRLSW